MKKNENFVLICDIFGTMIEKIPKKDNDFIDEGENVLKIIAAESQRMFFEFLKRIKEETYIMGYEINLEIEGKIESYYLHGFIKDERITITFFANEDRTTEMMTEIVKINNKQINELRKKYKEQAQEKEKIEEDVYIEITKLNSELLNSKRTIEKQNAQLSKYNLLLENLAMKDHLTEAYNRRYFYDKAPKIAEELAKKQGKMFLTTIDLNYFKKLNDEYGHDVGDKMLKSLVFLCKENSGKDDLVFRVGGDEFLIIFINKDKKDIKNIMENIEKGYKKLTEISSISYGTAEVKLDKDKKLDTKKIESYLKKADRLMYHHKAKVKSYETYKSNNNPTGQ